MNDNSNDDVAFGAESEMDRQSWLWRRKSSDKSPVETDTSSFSSLSERFSDDQKAYALHTAQSPEVNSKLVINGEEGNDDVRSLGNKLSAALLNISAKEDLIKQHAKVAEEAVSGWEKAEKELFTVKQQLEAATKKNLGLEDRVVHLDAALKECVRQLRQAREEQDQKINEAIAGKTREWESIKSELESKLVEFKPRLQATEAEASIYSDLKLKLEAAENENSSLKFELLSKAEEIEIRIMERDLSIQSAETASKHHLECLKKVAKLEAECRRLKTIARKASSPAVDHKSFTASSSACSDSCASSIVTEFDDFKNQKDIGRKLMVPAVELDFMDDFLEMEKLAALPNSETGISYLEGKSETEQTKGVESPLKAELQIMIDRTAELEEKIERLEEEKVEAQMLLSECQRKLEISLIQQKEGDGRLVELQAQLTRVNQAKQVVEKEIEMIKARRDVAESQLLVAEAENKSLHLKLSSLNAEVLKERDLSAENVVKIRKLEEELSEMKREAEKKRVASFDKQLKINHEKEVAEAASKFAECQKTISTIGQRLRSLATMEDFLLDLDSS